VIHHVRGTVGEKAPGRVIVDVGGFGLELLVSVSTWNAAGSVGAPVRLLTHLAVREDAHTLYGFLDRDTRDLFRLLLRVRGVGPTMALAVLSGLDRHELCDAILAEDTARLTRVKGVGKKTAEQILLDLREKAPRMLGAAARATLVPQAPPVSPAVEDAVRALVSIGYSDKEARKSVESAAARHAGAGLELLVRSALQE
jgi:Holliday junction DNA helicase RuvA